MNLTKIVNSNAPKMTKAKCFIELKKLIDVLPEETDQDIQRILGTLYQHFLPPTPKKPKTREQWVQLAKGNNDVRYYLNYVYSNGENLVATDGHRVHIMKDTPLTKGCYDADMQFMDDNWNFPDYERLLLTGAVETQTSTKAVMLSNTVEADPAHPKTGERVVIHDTLFNLRYVQDALALFDDDQTVMYNIVDNKLQIEDEASVSIVMATRP